ncbi:MAG TPA: FAD-dependent monooxygenase [Bryobacteraceae bacterium]
MAEIQIIGAGPAGSAAAIGALQHSAAVRIADRARETRHKVCGEFISPEASGILEQLGVWQEFLGVGPSCIRRCALHFGSRVKAWKLPESAFGLSRLALDRLLLERARSLGAAVERGVAIRAAEQCGTTVLASGRGTAPRTASRLFGFKAHFRGPATDAVELYFTEFGYVGINPIENGLTNVCGIAPEHRLRECGFDLDELASRSSLLAERVRPLTRTLKWLTTGPLTFSRPQIAAGTAYAAGDALGFVDPFTGSGILNALLTGWMAGTAAARQLAVAEHLRSCRALLERPAMISGLFRAAIQRGYADHLAWLVPGRWMYRLTRVAVRP